MKLLTILMGSKRLPLLLWLAGQARVTHTDIVREFPAASGYELNRAIRDLGDAGWLVVERGRRSVQFVSLSHAAVDALEAELDATLPGEWPAARFDEDALQQEFTLWTAPNRLRVLAALRAGADTVERIAAHVGLGYAGVRRAVAELMARGNVIERDWRRWEELNADPLTEFYAYQPGASQLRLLVALLRGAA